MTWVACFIHTIIINYSRHHYMFFALAMQSSTSTSDMQIWIHLLFRFQKEIKKQHMKAKISLAFLFLQRTKQALPCALTFRQKLKCSGRKSYFCKKLSKSVLEKLSGIRCRVFLLRAAVLDVSVTFSLSSHFTDSLSKCIANEK